MVMIFRYLERLDALVFVHVVLELPSCLRSGDPPAADLADVGRERVSKVSSLGLSSIFLKLQRRNTVE